MAGLLMLYAKADQVKDLLRTEELSNGLCGA